VESVRADEHLHTALMEEKRKQLTDPAVKVEGLIHPDDAEALKLIANAEIVDIETKLTDAAGKDGHPKIEERPRRMGFAKRRTIHLPVLTDEGRTFRDFTASFAELGIED
jgi:hypothetical protein